MKNEICIKIKKRKREVVKIWKSNHLELSSKSSDTILLILLLCIMFNSLFLLSYMILLSYIFGILYNKFLLTKIESD